MKLLDMFKRRGIEIFEAVAKLPNATRVTTKNATQISGVYAAVAVISDAVAGLPLNLYSMQGQKRTIANNHPLQALIKYAPNAIHTPYSFMEAIVKSMLIYGNAFIYPVLNRKGDVISLDVINPELISIDDSTDSVFYIYNSGSKNVKLSQDELINIPYFSTDGINGLSPIKACKNSLELAMACDKYANTFFQNAARPAGVIKTQGTLSTEQAKRLSDSWQNTYSGTGAGRTAVLEGGATYENITVSNTDAEFSQIRQFQINEVARIFNLPAHKIGDLSRATFSNIEQQEINFITQTIRPIVNRIESALNRHLIRENERGKLYFKFNVNAILRGDTKTRFESYQLGRNMGVYSVNDIRGLEDLDPIAGGDDYDKPLNSNVGVSKNDKANKDS